MLKAVIFDLDNTFYSYEECHELATKKVYEYFTSYYKISYSEYVEKLEQAKKNVKKNLENTAASHNRIFYFQKLLEDCQMNPIGKADKMYEIYWSSFFNRMVLRDGCLELLNFLKNKKIKIALCTDLTAYLQYQKIKKLEVAPYIDYMVTSEEVGVEKPDKKMFHSVIQKMAITEEECLYIGDDIKKDIEGAQKAGIEAIQIKDNFYDIIKEIERRVENG